MTDLKDAFDRQEAGRDGIPASELVKLFWTAGVDDAAVTVEEFLHEKEDKSVSIGLDEFLRLYDHHENRMIASMSMMPSKKNPPRSEPKNTVVANALVEEHAKGEAGAGPRATTFVWAQDRKNEVTRQIPGDIVKKLQIVFESYDMNNDGVISFIDLRTCFAQRGKQVPDAEIRRWISVRTESLKIFIYFKRLANLNFPTVGSTFYRKRILRATAPSLLTNFWPATVTCSVGPERTRKVTRWSLKH